MPTSRSGLQKGPPQNTKFRSRTSQTYKNKRSKQYVQYLQSLSNKHN